MSLWNLCTILVCVLLINSNTPGHAFDERIEIILFHFSNLRHIQAILSLLNIESSLIQHILHVEEKIKVAILVRK